MLALLPTFDIFHLQMVFETNCAVLPQFLSKHAQTVSNYNLELQEKEMEGKNAFLSSRKWKGHKTN